jgi:hypothetical protein
LLYDFISVARERMSSNGTIASVISGYRDVSNCRLTPQERRDIFVQPVDVRARLYLSPFIKKYCLVGEVNRDGVLQVDVALAPAVERMQALNGIPLLGLRDRKKCFGIFIRILYAHTAMTISAYRLAKQIFVRRVVLVDQELIWKVEAHAAKRIPIARWLIYSD